MKKKPKAGQKKPAKEMAGSPKTTKRKLNIKTAARAQAGTHVG